MQTQFIYLASQSPRRAQLLDQLGVQYKMLLADKEENIEKLEVPRSKELATDYVRRVAKLKLIWAIRRRERRGLPVAPILAADTTVALGRKMLGKPAHPGEAREMLLALSGRTHRVLTAIAVSTGPHMLVSMNITRVEFSQFGAIEIDRYIETGEPRGKAGSYGIQGRAARWVKHLNGSYSGVMGLPLHETAVLLRQAGLRV